MIDVVSSVWKQTDKKQKSEQEILSKEKEQKNFASTLENAKIKRASIDNQSLVAENVNAHVGREINPYLNTYYHNFQVKSRFKTNFPKKKIIKTNTFAYLISIIYIDVLIKVRMKYDFNVGRRFCV